MLCVCAEYLSCGIPWKAAVICVPSCLRQNWTRRRRLFHSSVVLEISGDLSLAKATHHPLAMLFRSPTSSRDALPPGR